MNGRLRRLEGRGGEVDGPGNPDWRARYSYFRPLMRRYSGVLSLREQAEAARRLASAKGTAADNIRASVAAEDVGLGPPPESAASRATDERAHKRYEEWKAAQEDYFDPETGIARHLLEDLG